MGLSLAVVLAVLGLCGFWFLVVLVWGFPCLWFLGFVRLSGFGFCTSGIVVFSGFGLLF